MTRAEKSPAEERVIGLMEGLANNVKMARAEQRHSIGSFKVAWPLLVELMHMPHGTELRDVEMVDKDTILLVVAHPDIPDRGDGLIVELEPSVTKEFIRWRWFT